MKNTSTACDLVREDFLCSGSNSEYSYSATISNGVVSVKMEFDDKVHNFTSMNIYRIAAVVHEFYEERMIILLDQAVIDYDKHKQDQLNEMVNTLLSK